MYVVADDPVGRFVEIAVDEDLRYLPRNDDTREYAERLTRLRLHQPVFRARVLRAYERACAICRLKHVDLLDAAHILSDAEGGQPVVSNGLSTERTGHSPGCITGDAAAVLLVAAGAASPAGRCAADPPRTSPSLTTCARWACPSGRSSTAAS